MSDRLRVLLGGVLGFSLALAFILTGGFVSTLLHR